MTKWGALVDRMDVDLSYREGEAAADTEIDSLGDIFTHPPHYGGKLKQIVADCR